ncbi:unnamed protein product [Arctia plantaginis]|uniref:Uncharacterized protein n=1 Tax=Arctia plantaginis TaxID=874455 RepID=A0A8S1A7N0_ARCPL|nr:unnamed protein product [Arctia plantaginis]
MCRCHMSGRFYVSGDLRRRCFLPTIKPPTLRPSLPNESYSSVKHINMYFKVLAFSALLALCQAGIEEGHGQAVSSQSIVRHNEPTHQTTHHFSPVIEHSGPVLQHAAPVYEQAYLQHSGPVLHAAPLIQHVAPATIHHAPVVQHIASEHVEKHVSTA